MFEDSEYNALNWVKGEIEETLNQARHALESYVENPKDTAQLRFCVTYLHQVRGTLQMIELYGAALLCEELEYVALALLQDQIQNRDDAYEVLLRAILQLPTYLDRLQAGHKDIPLVLMPLLNDLRATRNQSLLSDTALFSPNLDVEAPKPVITTDGEPALKVEAQAKKLRPAYQAGLVNWFRDSSDRASLMRMQAVLDKLESSVEEDTLRQMFWVAGGVLEALAEGGLDVSVSIKSLLGQIDREIKQLIDEGAEALEKQPHKDLIKNLLFYVARSQSTGPRVVALKQAFSLDALLPEDDTLDQARANLAGPDSSLMRIVSDALKEELLHIKDALDLFVRHPKDSLTGLQAMETGLRQVADTLGMLGLGVLRSKIQEQCGHINDICSGQEQATDTGLMKIAGTLLHVESTLSGMSREGRLSGPEAIPVTGNELEMPEAEYRQLTASVVQESLADIAKVKSAVIQYATAPSDHGILADVPAWLGLVKGGLAMLGMGQASELLGEIHDYIKCELIEQSFVPDSQSIDYLADAITSIEYFLEAYLSNQYERPEILAFGRHSLSHLSHPTQRDESAAEETSPKAPVRSEDVDDEIIEVYLEEAADELNNIRKHLRSWQADVENAQALAIVRRAFHTLKGGGRLVGASRAGEFAWAIEHLLNHVIDGKVNPSPAIFEVLWQAVEVFPQLLAEFEGQGSVTIDIDALVEKADTLATPPLTEIVTPMPASPPEAESDLAMELEAEVETPESLAPEVQPPVADVVVDDVQALFARETRQRIQDLLQLTEQMPEEVTSLWPRTARLLHSLHGSARMAGVDAIAELAQALKQLVDLLEQESRPASAEYIGLIQQSGACILDLLDASHDPDTHATRFDLLASINEVKLGLTSPVVAPIPVEVVAPVTTPSHLENEVVVVFLEEAEELLRNIDSQLHDHSTQPEKGPWLEQLQRDLHTLKGGARMAELTVIGNLGHQLESLLSAITSDDLTLDKAIIALLQRGHDRLLHMVECVQNNVRLLPADGLLAEIEELLKAPIPASAVEQPVFVPHRPRPRVDQDAIAQEILQEISAAPQRAPSEQVRVRADTLDNLVNISAEIGIFESRLSQQLAVMRYNFGELELTIARLHDRLRSLEFEADSNVLRSTVNIREGFGHAHVGFDELEFDRFGQVQELARSLMESVSDLSSLHKLLRHQTREAETLLGQQDRLNNELQEGLMRTRMVPFSGVLPRLRRLIRQVSEEIGKQAELEVIGEQVELDRTVLSRLVPALEHLIRNAIDHGLESKEERAQLGKSETGRIRILLSHEGPEVVISFSDDGKGLDLERIRTKAIENGLMNQNARLTDNEVMQFILESGFTTAREITQLSGRGVGMDVVNREIKQLSGSLHIASEPRQGSRFTLRLPLTLATQNTLLVEVGADVYALPLRGFVDMTRGTPSVDEKGREIFHYNDHTCLYLHLNDLLGVGRKPTENKRLPPVLIFRTGDNYIALQTDKLRGHQAVVSKSVGPQLSAIQGISGGTILTDGRVALILDLHALVRSNIAQHMEFIPVTIELEEEKHAQPLALIVDDSITMRKVTSRLLLRHNYRTLTANDGVEAAGILQDVRPDIILLDVEMPRMDGFELASLIRHTESWKGIPIIMITSRTGDKHRNRAKELGVDHYLGKPFNEKELLDTMQQLIRQGTHHE